MRPVTFTPEDIIEAGKILQAEGRNITGFALRKKVGGGDANRLRQVWDEYQAGQSVVEHEPVAELPVEVAEEMKAVSVALTERIAQLTLELNDKAVRAAERRVAEVTRAAGEQTAQAERELADAAQTVDDLEETLDALRDEHSTTIAALDESRGKEQSQAVELAQLRERLASTEKRLDESEKAGNKAVEQHRQQLADMQDRLEDAGKKLAEAVAELRGTKEQHAGEVKELKAHHARNEEELKKRLDEAGKSASAELKARQTALDKALKEATEAREAKAAMTGELKALKSHNEQLAALLAGKKEPEEQGKTKK
ncbi:DNA-binding protein [Photorhabdus luminescens]|uniref:DNA-binding protein n=1 Tax=Photorhabdus luminescens TaxID=29488 RepID=UPI00223FD154|nr:DNA-binding protein [Photorhabdus luminescens]MCW7763388.1 DNA-binding protein [Photorhabdus luminescens subsp. venezuelensis]